MVAFPDLQVLMDDLLIHGDQTDYERQLQQDAKSRSSE